jgi:fumarate hydratase subunit beta
MSEIDLAVPLARDALRGLKLGDTVFLTGEIVATAGYPTHQRIVDCIDAGKPLPVDITGGALFHLGSFSREAGGRLEPLYVNPTTSTRFNAFMPKIARHFQLTAVAGKGGLDEESVRAFQEVGCIYFSMIGGVAPLLTAGVREVLATGWDDLIMQFRLTRLRVERFGPLTVAIDAHGGSLYRDIADSAQARLHDILAKLSAGRRAFQGTK